MAYIYDDEGNLVEHKGEITSVPFDGDKALLDYGWAVPPAVGIAYGAYKAAPTVIDWYKTRKEGGIDSRRMKKGDFVDVQAREVPDPFSAAVDEDIKALQYDKTSALRQKSAQVAEAMNAQKAAATPAPAAEPAAPGPIQRAAIPRQLSPENAIFSSAPKAPVPPVALPSGTDIAQAVVTEQLTSTPAEATEKTSNITKRVRRTNAEIQAAQEALQAKAPPGMKVDYKKPAGGIGPGAYHWFENQVGPQQAPALWRELFGERNVPLKEVQETYRNFAASAPEPYSPRGGTYGSTPYVPQYIKGSIDPMMALNLAGNALGAVGLMQAYKEGKKTGDYSDFGLGAIGQILGNVAPRAGLAFSLMTPSTTQAGHNEELAKRRKMQPTID